MSGQPTITPRREEKRRSILRGLAHSVLGRPAPPLGRVLVREGVISEEQLSRALRIQKEAPRHLGEILVEEGFASEIEILQTIAKHYGVSPENLNDDIGGLIRNRRRIAAAKMPLLRIPIPVKLSAAIIFSIWMTIITLSFVILDRQKDNLYQQTVKSGKMSLSYLVGDAAIPLLENDIVRLNTLMKEASSVEGIVYAVIVDREGIVKAHFDPTLIGSRLQPIAADQDVVKEGNISYFRHRTPEGRHLINLSRPVTFSEVELGQALVGVSLDFIDLQIRRESLNIIVLSFFLVLFGIAIAIKISYGFSKPITQLVAATQEIGKGNFKYRIRSVRRDEFGDLAAAFNYMSRELWKKLRMQKSFGSYVSPEILELVLARPEEDWLRGSRMHVTVLFTDIRGFTTYSEGREPEEIVAAVNRYFQIVTEHIQAEGGYVDKFIGDAVLGVFGAPVARDDHALRALRAAVAMQEAFRSELSQGNPLLGKVGIGINSGDALAGDLGSEGKKEYSVIGDCVNLASRLNSLAGPGQIIVSGETLSQAGAGVSKRFVGSVRIRGRKEEIETFEVLAAPEGEPSSRETEKRSC